MAFFTDIAQKFGLLPELAKQTWKTASAQNLEKQTASRLAAVQSPTATPTTGGFFTDIAQKFNLAQPQPFFTPETPLVKKAELSRQELKTKIGEPLVKALPFGIGARLSATPEKVEAIKEKYKDYSFTDVGKDLANMGLNFTVNVLSDLGLAGHELLTGKKAGYGVGYGFKDAKTFQPAVIGSISGIYQYNKAQGDSPAVAGIRTGVQFGFDLLMGFGIAKEGLPYVRSAARQLPQDLLWKFKTENMPVEEVLGSMIGSKSATPKGNAFISGLTNEERKSLFRLARAYEEAGGRVIPITEKTPTELGKFAGVEAAKIPTEIRPERRLPGYAPVGEPQPAFGLSIKPVKRVGGAPEIPKDLQPLAQEARIKGTKIIFESPTYKGRFIEGEFVKDVGDGTSIVKTKMAGFTDFERKVKSENIYNQAVKGVKAPAEEVAPIKRPPSLEKLGLKEKPTMITKPEDVLLRARIKSEARGAKTAVAQYKREQSILESISSQITRELNKPKGLQRSAISFVKLLGEFNQTVINEIKTELGIEKPITKMNLDELKSFTDKLKERLKFKFEKGYQPSVETKEKLNIKESPKPKLNEADYERNRQIVGKSKITPKKEFIKIGEKTKETAEKILTPISTRLENIDPSLKYALRKFEFEALNSINNDKKAIEPYLKKIRVKLFGKMTKDDFSDLDLALKNGDIDKIAEINKKYEIEKEYNEIHKTLDDIYKRANEVGFDIGYQKNYWPRMIKDTAGFLEYFGKQDYWSILDEAIKRKEMNLGRYLTDEEKANLINTMIRGYQGGQITLSGTGAMKGRVIDLITPELNQFYYNSPSSLVKYIEEVDDKIAARKFFGKGNKAEGFSNIEDSIGSYTADLLANGKITPKQELELRGILNARFNPKGTHGIVGLYKNLSYMDVMGSFLNAITQLGDQAWAIFRAGWIRTIKADIKSIFKKQAITKESLGIEANKIAQEFSDAGKTAKAIDKIFTLTGLNKVDRLGKEALVNGAIEKYQKLAKNPTIDFLKMIDNVFGKESEQVLKDLRNGQITENIKLLAFNELLDFHPVALSEMPETYLKGGNGRIFYMLKSYTLKQFDIFRREAFREMKRGNWWKGIGNLLYLTFLVVLCNGTADEIKDLLTNRKTKLSDRVIDQFAMLAGFSRYTYSKISEVGLGSAIVGQIIPPTNFIDNFSKDLLNLYKDFDKSANINKLKTIQDIPLIGKFYYWWFGKGAEITEKYQPKPSGVGLPSLPPLPKLPALPALPRM